MRGEYPRPAKNRATKPTRPYLALLAEPANALVQFLDRLRALEGLGQRLELGVQFVRMQLLEFLDSPAESGVLSPENVSFSCERMQLMVSARTCS